MNTNALLLAGIVATSASLPASAETFDAAKDFSLAANPNGVWSYMYQAPTGGAPTLFPKKGTGPLEPNAGTVSFWNTGAASWNAYHSVFANTGNAAATVSLGLVVQPGWLVLHPAANGQQSVLRFTAHAAGTYRVASTFTPIDAQAKNTDEHVVVNGVEAFKEKLTGSGKSATYAGLVELNKGETLDFVVGNGGDGFADDAVRLEASIVPLPLRGWWTFEPGSELVDRMGLWGPVELKGAKVNNGKLELKPNAWARATGYKGDPIREKTLVAWGTLNKLDVRAGALLSIDGVTNDNFDAIDFAERQPLRWMAGSSYFKRTQDAVKVDEKTVGQPIQMAIAYKDLGNGKVQITLCRDGVQLAQYESANMTEWNKDNVEVLFGPRHTVGNQVNGAVDANLDDARIYGVALTCDEVKTLKAR